VASEFDQPLIDPGGLRDAEGHRVSGATILSIIIAVLVLAAVIGALYYIGSRFTGDGAEETPKEQAAEQEQQEEEAAAPSRIQEKESNEASNASGSSERSDKASAGSNAAETVQVTVKVLNSPAGLTILKDGTVAADVFAQPGFSQTFEAQTTVTVSTANAGAVEVEANGQNMGRLGSYGQPVTRDFTPTSSKRS
jgi:cytoskeletal protein RodZ